MKGRLKEQYVLLEVDSKNYKVVECEELISVPKLLSLSEFKSGKTGLLLYNRNTEGFTFGPENFGKLK